MLVIAGIDEHGVAGLEVVELQQCREKRLGLDGRRPVLRLEPAAVVYWSPMMESSLT
jgi:hypothetical protein